jgi:hypothetical protein
MAKVPQISGKRVAISKANAQMVGIVAAASFVTVFCLIASKAVLSQNQYQSRLTTAKQKAHKQLQQNLSAFDELVKSYQAFDSTPTNVIGGVADGKGDNDGKNSKIILDALPPTYDFPALTSSIEKIVVDNHLKVESITGTDDEVAQQANSSSPKPQPVPIPFTVTVSNANYTGIQQLVKAFQLSIRPIAVDKIEISGGASNMSVTITAHTYYQPAKSVSITKQVIK